MEWYAADIVAYRITLMPQRMEMLSAEELHRPIAGVLPPSCTKYGNTYADCYNLTKAGRSSDLAALHLSEAEA